MLVDNGSVGVVSSYPFTNVTKDHTIHAMFSEAEETDGPTIDRFDLTRTSNPQFARVRVNWGVSGVNLSTVLLGITGPNDDSQTWTVSGSSASGEHEFSFRRGFGSYRVTLTVTGDGGKTTTETRDIEL